MVRLWGVSTCFFKKLKNIYFKWKGAITIGGICGIGGKKYGAGAPGGGLSNDAIGIPGSCGIIIGICPFIGCYSKKTIKKISYGINIVEKTSAHEIGMLTPGGGTPNGRPGVIMGGIKRGTAPEPIDPIGNGGTICDMLGISCCVGGG